MAYIRKTKDVHISPKLIEILNKIATKSEVAKRLLKTKISKEELVDDPVDYLTISKKDPTKISYAYPEKLAKIEDPEEYWTFKGRVEAKPASAVKKVLKDVSEKDLDLFTSLFKAAVAPKEYEFQIVQGEDIKKYYHQNSYNRNKYGTLSNSCMKHDHCKYFFSIYTENPEVCQMLIMLDSESTLLGRALLWNAVNVETGTEVKVMDRIYCMEDEKNIHYFKEWADENGYITRKNQKWADCLRFQSHGKDLVAKISIQINKKDYNYFPYVDTFKFWDSNKSIISNFIPQDTKYLKVLTDNTGRTCGPNTLSYDNLQGTYEDTSRLQKLEYPINGEYYMTISELLHYSDFQDMYMLREHSVWSEEVEDYVLVGEYAQYNDQELLEQRFNYIKSKKNKKQSGDWGYDNLKALRYSEYLAEQRADTDEEIFGEVYDDYEIPAEAPRPIADPIQEFIREFRINVEHDLVAQLINQMNVNPPVVEQPQAQDENQIQENQVENQ